MRRTTPTVMAALLALSATPAMAQDAEDAVTESAESAELVLDERVEAPEVGLSMAFPEGWRVSHPQGTRVSAISGPEGEPVIETTAVLANGGGGTWCDVDIYFDMTTSLEQHAFAYSQYLQQIQSSDASMVVLESELPAGPSYRIEIFDPSSGLLRSMHLLDGPAKAEGVFDRYLLTCATTSDVGPFSVGIAESMELTEPVPAEPESESETEA
jgi:hypothetical protein